MLLWDAQVFEFEPAAFDLATSRMGVNVLRQSDGGLSQHRRHAETRDTSPSPAGRRSRRTGIG
jgi:hypothetical protein